MSANSGNYMYTADIMAPLYINFPVTRTIAKTEWDFIDNDSYCSSYLLNVLVESMHGSQVQLWDGVT